MLGRFTFFRNENMIKLKGFIIRNYNIHRWYTCCSAAQWCNESETFRDTEKCITVYHIKLKSAKKKEKKTENREKNDPT